MAEIRRFLASKLWDPRDEYYRKVFCIQLLTGLYYSDLRALEVGNFHSTTFTEHGKKVTKHYLEGERSKNGERFIIPLLPQTVELLKEISNLNGTEDRSTNLFSELLSDQKYNQRLKKIAKSLGIHKNISNKTGRHSYSVMMVGAGNSRAKVGASMGHTKEDTTRVYSKLSIEETLRGWIEPDL